MLDSQEHRWRGSVRELSRAVLVGFLTGVGIQVAAGQLPDMLGVTAAGGQTLQSCAGDHR